MGPTCILHSVLPNLSVPPPPHQLPLAQSRRDKPALFSRPALLLLLLRLPLLDTHIPSSSTRPTLLRDTSSTVLAMITWPFFLFLRTMAPSQVKSSNSRMWCRAS